MTAEGAVVDRAGRTRTVRVVGDHVDTVVAVLEAAGCEVLVVITRPSRSWLRVTLVDERAS